MNRVHGSRCNGSTTFCMVSLFVSPCTLCFLFSLYSVLHCSLCIARISNLYLEVMIWLFYFMIKLATGIFWELAKITKGGMEGQLYYEQVWMHSKLSAVIEDYFSYELTLRLSQSIKIIFWHRGHGIPFIWTNKGVGRIQIEFRGSECVPKW